MFGSYVKGLANSQSDVELLIDSGLKGLKFVGLIEDVRFSFDKEVDVFDANHIVKGSKILSEIDKLTKLNLCNYTKMVVFERFCLTYT